MSLNNLVAVEEFGALVQYGTAYAQVLLVVQAEIKQFFLSEIQEQTKMNLEFIGGYMDKIWLMKILCSKFRCIYLIV